VSARAGFGGTGTVRPVVLQTVRYVVILCIQFSTLDAILRMRRASEHNRSIIALQLRV